MILYNDFNKRVIIFGTGKNADIMGHYIEAEAPVAAYTVHKKYINSSTFRNKPLVPFENLRDEFSPDRYKLFVAVGYNKLNHLRADIFNEARSLGYSFISYINNKCMVSSTISEDYGLSIGYNTFIFELNNLQYKVMVGNNVMLWAGNHIGHETIIGDHVYLSSHVVISGSCYIGDYTFMGVNASIADGVRIGKNNLIGAGVYVGRSTKDKQVFASFKPRILTFEELSPQAQEMWRPL